MSRRSRMRREGGFTPLQVVVVAAMLATIAATIGVGLRSRHVAHRDAQRRAQLTLTCSELMERLFHIPFGVEGAVGKRARAAQLNELFDGDDDLGTATLTSLRIAPGQPGLRFEIESYPPGGTFEVRVEEQGGGKLLHIGILHDGILILESLRSASKASS